MILSRSWRQRDLERRYEVWGNRIGRAATTDQAHGSWWGQLGFFILLVWVGTTIVAELAKAPGAVIAWFALLWLVILYCFGQYVHLILKAQREAGEVAGTSEKARPPVRNVAAFDTWAKRSKYSRFRDATPGTNGQA